jgi:hypothetical protein
MKLEFSPQIFKKYTNIKFHENPSVGKRGVHGIKGTNNLTEGQADIMNLIVAFRNFAKSPKNASVWSGTKLKNNYI